jgi:hypothetical protein
VKRRAAALWLVLLVVYASTIGIDAAGRSEYAGDEPHYLLTARSFVQDGGPDLTDEYAAREYREFVRGDLRPDGALTNGRLNEPHGIGFPLLIAPAYAIGGPHGVELLLAALAALAVALAYLLAQRAGVPDPWALGASLAVGLSPPLLAYSTAVLPELPAAAILCGAALLALQIDARPSRRIGWTCLGLLALLPWLGVKYLLAAVPIGFYAWRALRRARRPVLAITSVEIVGFSVALFVGLSEGLYGGPTPYSADAPGQSATGAGDPIDYLERSYRAIALFADRHFGLLRWAPVLALALYGAWLLLRERRSGLARAIPALRAEQSAGVLCAAVAGAQLVVAVFPAPLFAEPGFAFPGRQLVAALPVAIPLVALALRRVPRIGALLGVITFAASVWIWLHARLAPGGGFVRGLPDAPFGPLDVVLPRFVPGAIYPWVFGAVAVTSLAAAIVLTEWRRSHRVAAE